jgi:hypothetical protein
MRLVLLCEDLEPIVFKDFAEIFLLGASLKVLFEDVAEEGDLPKARFFRGVSEANCRTVEIL